MFILFKFFLFKVHSAVCVFFKVPEFLDEVYDCPLKFRGSARSFSLANASSSSGTGSMEGSQGVTGR